jgi:nucleoside-diphosphate-sugar epimerase/short-subunit dehydrogenase involved in D-alanine esterification of teichoic acids
MRVLVTGAFGNIGQSTVEELLAGGHTVRCFDVANRANHRSAARFRRRVQVTWGDLREPAEVRQAIQGMEAVIHLAFVIPKLSATGVGCEDQPDLAWQINVGGTANLLAACRMQQPAPRILFASSLHVYGITGSQAPPRKVTDPLKPMENYARHKVECERLVRESGLPWVIFRLAAALPFSLTLDSALFEVPLDSRMEYVHTRDVGLALARAVDKPEVLGRILHLGGGPRCQYLYGQIAHKILSAAGVGMLPVEAFTRRPFSTDWLDTQESQRLLRFQRFTLDDFAPELSRRLGWRRIVARIFRPLVRALLLSRSPYYHTRDSDREAWRGKVALVTCASDSFGQAVARRLAQEGLRIVLARKPGEDLTELAFQLREEGGEAQVFPADLSREQSVFRLLAQVQGSCGPVRILVNHADLQWINGRQPAAWRGSWDRIEHNVLGIVRLTELAVEQMKSGLGGQVIFIEPALKLFPAQPTPLLAATRAFFRAFAQRLGALLRGTRVRVSLVKAGISTTELFRLAPLRTLLGRRSTHGLEVRPEALANRIWSLIIRPQRIIYVPGLMAVFSWMEKYAGWLVELIRDRMLPARANLSG